ncbi:MAG TPA: MlaD family protein [Noviherbaspirillum sp.]|uniref:MlaD family protein n=1 Tax=Noviherbaspirillum sp. TaxID=1926288 RepID=UPI002D54E110|nr:MlaD family protein [Noviherbaspirillum sp.]HYD97463.1 MlaD family protein [Noviherbaspirillum sp.]
MENKAHALLAGLFTIVLLAAAVFIALWLNRDRVERVPYQIATKLSVPGLNPQAAVRYRGLDIGKVDDITFDPQVVGQILVHISVQPDTPITQSTFATLGYQGVTGIAYVQLDDDGSRPVKLHSTPQQVARIEMRPSLFDQLQSRGLAILQQTEEVARRVNDMLSPDNQKAILTAFNNVSRAAEEIETIPRQLQPSLARLPAVTAQAQRTLSSLDVLSRDASALAASLNSITTRLNAPGGTIATITDTAERLGSVADRLEHDTLPLANDARSSIRALTRALDNLSERPQSVLFGSPANAPGPGEDGFALPSGASQ